MNRKLKKYLSLIVIICLCTVSATSIYGATILEEDKARAGVITKYSDSPKGSPSDYTEVISSYDGSEALDAQLCSVTVGALTSILLPVLGVSDVASATASIILGGAGLLGDTEYLYYHVTIKGHKDDTWAYRQKKVTYYYDKNHNYYADSATVYIYQYWY